MDTERKVKCAQLDLLYELHRICQKWDIPYFLIGGTLIGAIRHGGFIPWDDDIDVGLLWEDYARLEQACKQDLDPAYMLCSWHTDPYSPHPFYKLKIRNTHYTEELSVKSKMDDGIFIDIFPYDNAPDDPKLRKKQAQQVQLLRKILLVRCGFRLDRGNVFKRLIYGSLKLFSRVRSVKGWKRSFEKVQHRYNQGKTQVVTNMGGSYTYERESKPRALVEKIALHKFENGEFCIPADYDTFLRSCYGDYMQLPPEDQRIGRHGVLKVDFGGYQIRNTIKE